MDSSDCELTAMTRTDTGLAIVVGGKPAFRAMQALPMQTISNMLDCHWMARRFVAHGQLCPVRTASLRAGPRIGPGSRIQRCNLKRCISCYPSVRDWTEAAAGPKSSSPRLCTRTRRCSVGTFRVHNLPEIKIVLKTQFKQKKVRILFKQSLGI
jgi:hypothetical protein